MQLTVALYGTKISSTTKNILEYHISHFDQFFALKPIEISKYTDTIDADNEATFRNEVLKVAKGDYILWIDENTELDEDFFDETIDTIEESDAHIIYPNEIAPDNKIVNRNEWYNKEIALLINLSVEQEIPKWGTITKRASFNDSPFDPAYGPATFHHFIYKHIKNIKLKLNEYVFVRNEVPNYIDTSYHSLMIRDIVSKYDLKHDIFPFLDWARENVGYSTAYTFIGDKLKTYNDNYNALLFYNKALTAFHNQTSTHKLLECYLDMGLFAEAKRVIQTQLDDNRQVWLERIDSLSLLIDRLEQAVNSKNFKELNEMREEILSTYDGALIYNIFGVADFYQNRLLNAYENFVRAAIKNPLDQDILRNLASVAKKLHKEEDVIGLYERLTKSKNS